MTSAPRKKVYKNVNLWHFTCEELRSVTERVALCFYGSWLFWWPSSPAMQPHPESFPQLKLWSPLLTRLPPHPASDRPPYHHISPRRAATRHGWPKENPNHRSAHPTSCLYFHDESNLPNQASTARPWTETVYTFNRPSHPKQAAGGDQGCINCTIRPCFVHRVQCI